MTPAPVRKELDAAKWPHGELLRRVRAALLALPAHFRAETNIEGVAAPDLFTLNTMLGATIEDQVVAALNRMRQAWDPDGEYAHAGFVRQAQTFPDVRLEAGADQPIMGIELKGWYLLSKEKEPSFRYRVTPDACADQDLLVVAPWALKNVLSGAPTVFRPFVEFARYAAEKRNHYWENERETRGDRRIVRAEGVRPYPAKTDRIDDVPVKDAGNFGRIARCGVMDDFIKEALERDLRGIPAKFWLEFIKTFAENRDASQVSDAMERLRKKIREEHKGADPNLVERILDILQQEYPE